MLEAVRVRKEGFAYRPYFSDFVRDYRNIAFKFTDTVLSCMCTDSHAVSLCNNCSVLLQNVKLSEATCVTILNKTSITGWKLGKSRVS